MKKYLLSGLLMLGSSLAMGADVYQCYLGKQGPENSEIIKSFKIDASGEDVSDFAMLVEGKYAGVCGYSKGEDNDSTLYCAMVTPKEESGFTSTEISSRGDVNVEAFSGMESGAKFLILTHTFEGNEYFGYCEKNAEE